jgi:hypothetical protein
MKILKTIGVVLGVLVIAAIWALFLNWIGSISFWALVGLFIVTICGFGVFVYKEWLN